MSGGEKKGRAQPATIHQHGKVDMLKAARPTVAEPVVGNIKNCIKTKKKSPPEKNIVRKIIV
ncbi:MAG: hypothetical protein JXA91_04105 [Candidatus Thermoplasmatota archaeon]|nr:hypothetical protein [Candidatus Thermoplasmatota archaeon]